MSPCRLQYGFHYGSSYFVKLSFARIKSSIYSYSALSKISSSVGCSSKFISYTKNRLQLSKSFQFESSQSITVICYDAFIQIIRESMDKDKVNTHLQILKKIIEKNECIFSLNQEKQTSQANLSSYTTLDFVIKQQKTSVKTQLQKAGFINSVYILNDKYVAKIEDKIQDITTHQIELLSLAALAGVKSPKLIDFGEFYGKKYILMDRLKGDRLWKYWFFLNETQKQGAIKQLCWELQKLHQIQFTHYSPKRPKQFLSACQAIKWYNKEAFDLSEQKAGNKDQQALKNLSYLKLYFQQNIKILEKEKEKAVFVHNDLHFGNLLYELETKQITGILDFDFSRQLNKDYELWHFIQFLAHPQLYVEKQFREEWQNFEVGNQLKYMRKHYPQLLQDQNKQLKGDLAIKLRLYFMDQILYFFISDNIGQFNQKIEKLYKSNWLESILEKTQ